jgi:hypothetical protein
LAGCCRDEVRSVAAAPALLTERNPPQHVPRVQGGAAAYERHPGGKWNVLTLPDITIWTAPGQHHEIKHKCPTRYGCYGLEQYRFDALLWFAETTKQLMYYTIHDHSLSGGRDCQSNSIDHQRTASVTHLADNIHETRWGYSWVDGVKKSVPIHYWAVSHWQPLRQIWES